MHANFVGVSFISAFRKTFEAVECVSECTPCYIRHAANKRFIISNNRLVDACRWSRWAVRALFSPTRGEQTRRRMRVTKDTCSARQRGWCVISERERQLE